MVSWSQAKSWLPWGLCLPQSFSLISSTVYKSTRTHLTDEALCTLQRASTQTCLKLCCSHGAKLIVIWNFFPPKTVLCLNMAKIHELMSDFRSPGPALVPKSDWTQLLSCLFSDGLQGHCTHHLHAWCPKGQRRVLDVLELWLPMTASHHHVGGGDTAWVHSAISPALETFFNDYSMMLIIYLFTLNVGGQLGYSKFMPLCAHIVCVGGGVITT